MIRDNMGQLRGLIREILLRESSGGESLAAFIDESGSYINITLYDGNALVDVVSSPEFEGINSPSFERVAMKQVMKGVIKIVAPSKNSGPCYGAWQVVKANGEGYGRELYGLAYAMSPSGKLISDREQVSDDAIDGWKNAASKRKALPLDNLWHIHKTPESYHTDDPQDDCRTYSQWPGEKDINHLNFAYEANGSEGAILASLTANHATTLERAQGAVGDPSFAGAFETKIKKFFSIRFGSWTE
jgi:hypothetical protein